MWSDGHILALWHLSYLQDFVSSAFWASQLSNLPLTQHPINSGWVKHYFLYIFDQLHFSLITYQPLLSYSDDFMSLCSVLKPFFYLIFQTNTLFLTTMPFFDGATEFLNRKLSFLIAKCLVLYYLYCPSCDWFVSLDACFQSSTCSPLSGVTLQIFFACSWFSSPSGLKSDSWESSWRCSFLLVKWLACVRHQKKSSAPISLLSREICLHPAS